MMPKPLQKPGIRSSISGPGSFTQTFFLTNTNPTALSAASAAPGCKAKNTIRYNSNYAYPGNPLLKSARSLRAIAAVYQNLRTDLDPVGSCWIYEPLARVR